MTDSPPNGETPPRGIRCRQCGCGHFWVIYVCQRLGKIERRRECRNCGKRVTTFEKVAGS